ncbi:MAG: hypothetical protein Q4B96_02800 [Bacillota bacterium]|nr:hypothetical protein [Bacillota bacterium]
MDFSAANTNLWGGILQIAIVCALMLLANVLRRKLPVVRKSLMPTAVLAGFIALALRYLNVLPINIDFMETITYHAIALGFIALALRVPKPLSVNEKGRLIGLKSGALIVSTYLVQAVIGLVISLGLAYTFMPGMFKAAGILLPMAYGQGPGQANNIGITYENLGFVGGQSFGLSLAAAGFLVACVCGVIYLNYLQQKGLVKRNNALDISGSVTLDEFQNDNEIPISESVDRFSMQMALVMVVYGLTYVMAWVLTTLFTAAGVGGLLNSLIWGFNFIIGTGIAIGLRAVFVGLRKYKVMTRQYQNNYLLSRIAGAAFDAMVITGIVSIRIEELQGLWTPFLLMAILGGVGTFLYLRWICKRLYPEYYHEGFVSMFGMLTGTISSGVLLLREIDPNYRTPASNNLILGTSFGILLGAPILVLVGLAASSAFMAFVTLLLALAYLALMLFVMLRLKRRGNA